MFRISFFIFLTFIITGCATLNDEFSCGIGPGVGCTSIDEVNKMVNDGFLVQDSLSVEGITPALNVAHVASDTISELAPVRLPDQTQRIYIAPYTENDNFHTGQFIFTVVKKSRWL